ncbi:hypothetical protein ABZP36_000471 [Zizania latifolia]
MPSAQWWSMQRQWLRLAPGRKWSFFSSLQANVIPVGMPHRSEPMNGDQPMECNRGFISSLAAAFNPNAAAPPSTGCTTALLPDIVTPPNAATPPSPGYTAPLPDTVAPLNVATSPSPGCTTPLPDTATPLRMSGVSKGLIAEKMLTSMKEKLKQQVFVLCIGDDRSDEDMLKILPMS